MKPEDRKRIKRFWLVKGLLLTSAIGGITIGITRGPILQDTFFHETNFLSYEPIAIKLSRKELGTAIGDVEEARTLLNLGNKIAAPILLKLLTSKRCILEFLLLYGLITGSTAALLGFSRLRNPCPISWSSHLLLPEETIAELITLKCRLQRQNLPQWKLNLELTTEVLLLLWAIHIQVRLQNLSLPPSKKHNID